MSAKKKQKTAKRVVKVACVTGTPGVGKTTICSLVKERLGDEKVMLLNVGDLIKEKKLYSEWDDEMNASIFDEDLVADELKRIAKQCDKDGVKGLLIDFHSVGFIPAKLVDHVIAVRADTEPLWQRLEKRGYKESKIQENIQAEIFMESFTEAIEEFGEEIVEEMPNNSEPERDAIVEKLCSLFTE